MNDSNIGHHLTDECTFDRAIINKYERVRPDIQRLCNPSKTLVFAIPVDFARGEITVD